MQINPDLYQEITQLADLLRAKFSPTEFIPGCLVKSVADKSQYATNNGWIEAVCGQHNQQRVRWKSNVTVAVNDYVDVLYFPDRRLFEAYGPGGAGAIAGADIPDGSVTDAKLADMPPGNVKGRGVSAGTGPPTDVTGVTLANIAFGASANGDIIIGDTALGWKKLNSGGNNLFLKTVSGHPAWVNLTVSETSAGIAEIATQAEADAGTDDLRIVTPLKLRTTPQGIIKVKNTSGVTATAGMVGHIDYIAGAGQEFRLTITSTADLAARACYVVTGGANNADIYVVTRGRFNLSYSGSAPSIGDYLIFSSTAGSVVAQTFMSPDVIAIAQAAGGGGLVDALLLTGTQTVLVSSSNTLYLQNSSNGTLFTATINGAPTATSFVYNAPGTGNENILPPGATTELAKLVIRNTTRNTDRLVTAVNTGTNTVTTVSVADAWATTDAITIASPNVINDGLATVFEVLDVSQTTEIPALARSLIVSALITDSGGAGALCQVHPYEAFVTSKSIPVIQSTQTVQTISAPYVAVPLIQNRFGMRVSATGTGTMNRTIKLVGYTLAVP